MMWLIHSAWNVKTILNHGTWTMIQTDLAVGQNGRSANMKSLINFLCQRCIGETNTSTRIEDLCDNHYFEWANEKICYDLDMSTEGLYL